jgi:FlaA1/EpsC-like NDP-sugar epimerase
MTQVVETMIRRSGLKPGRDIEIVFTGIRPGEKLEESLDLDAETTERTAHNRIFVSRIPRLSTANVEALLVQCIALAAEEGALDGERLRTVLTEEGNKDEVL